MTRSHTGHGRLEWLRELPPAYFALAMATGTLSNGFWQLGLKSLSNLFYWLNWVIYPVLVGLLIVRALWAPKALRHDLLDPRQVFTFFTLVAASCVFGEQLGYRELLLPALWLMVGAAVLWLVLGYLSFGVLAFRNDHRRANVTHGGWLLWIVATQALVVLATQLFHLGAATSSLGLMLLFGLWGFGVMWYGVFITIFFNRISFELLHERDINPVYWVLMGSAAISVDAGVELLSALPQLAVWNSARTLIEAAVLILWIWSSWLIPTLLMLDGWKHLIRREPLRYTPTVWASVFPAAMYMLATQKLSLIGQFGPLRVIVLVAAALASVAWGVAMFGLMRQLWQARASED